MSRKQKAGAASRPPARRKAEVEGRMLNGLSSPALRLLAIAALAAGLLVLSAWWWWPRPAPAATAAGGPDVLLVTIDTLRADRVGCYGDRQAATPMIDALAARGTRFAEAIAPVPLTLPSHASILTGVTPLVHGVRDNAGFVLGDHPETLAEAFAHAGYETAAFVSGFPVHRRFGLARGFATYDDRFPRGDDPSRPPYVERRASETVAAAREWLARQPAGARPLFAWLHLFDPHAPYDPPEPYRSQFRANPYEGEIAFADAQLGVFLAAWRAARPGREPVVLVTGDHGEGLGDHGEPTHGLFIYDSTLRVPLVVAGPGVPAGKVVHGAVGSIDIAPTLLDLAGVRPIPGVEGQSLRAAAQAGRAPGAGIYAESLFGRLAFGWAPLHGWRSGGLMYIEAPRPELYDIARDPSQLANLVKDRDADVARMHRSVDAAVAKAPEARPAPATRDAAERLRSLGYVASGPAGRPSLRDPKDFAALAVRIENAIAAERADPSRAVAEFRAALREDPENAVARRHLAMALVSAHQFDAARRELEALHAAGEESLESLTLLGDANRLAGHLPDALSAFTRAAAKDPSAPEGYDGQGKVLTALGRTEEARRAFEQAVRVTPDDPEGLEGLADLALARGDLAEARARLDALVARDANDAPVALKRGVVLVRLGEVEDAIGVFRSVLDREPANAEAATDLAGALAKSGRAGEAVGYFERAIMAGAKGPVVWNGLAMARLQSGNQAGAVDALRQSLRAKPDQPNIRELLDRVVGR